MAAYLPKIPYLLRIWFRPTLITSCSHGLLCFVCLFPLGVRVCICDTVPPAHDKDSAAHCPYIYTLSLHLHIVLASKLGCMQAASIVGCSCCCLPFTAAAFCSLPLPSVHCFLFSPPSVHCLLFAAAAFCSLLSFLTAFCSLPSVHCRCLLFTAAAFCSLPLPSVRCRCLLFAAAAFCPQAL